MSGYPLIRSKKFYTKGPFSIYDSLSSTSSDEADEKIQSVRHKSIDGSPEKEKAKTPITRSPSMEQLRKKRSGSKNKNPLDQLKIPSPVSVWLSKKHAEKNPSFTFYKVHRNEEGSLTGSTPFTVKQGIAENGSPFLTISFPPLKKAADIPDGRIKRSLFVDGTLNLLSLQINQIDKGLKIYTFENTGDEALLGLLGFLHKKDSPKRTRKLISKLNELDQKDPTGFLNNSRCQKALALLKMLTIEYFYNTTYITRLGNPLNVPLFSNDFIINSAKEKGQECDVAAQIQLSDNGKIATVIRKSEYQVTLDSQRKETKAPPSTKIVFTQKAFAKLEKDDGKLTYVDYEVSCDFRAEGEASSEDKEKLIPYLTSKLFSPNI